MIRLATPHDAASIAGLWNPWIRDTAITFTPVEKSEADIVTMIHDRQAAHGFWVADTGQVQGFATYSQFRGGPGYATCMEHTIILSHAARGAGLGRALMAVLEDHAHAKGVHQMIGGISAENHDARAFHASLGYHELAVIPQAGFKFGRFIDLVLMQKFLS